MNKYLIVGVGSALGGMLRYWLSNFVYKFLQPIFPFGTLAVNILGTFLLGIIFFFLDSQELLSPSMRIFLTIGLCGGLTTFSTFSYETFIFIEDTQYLFAFLNILSNIILTLLSLALAYLISIKLF